MSVDTRSFLSRDLEGHCQNIIDEREVLLRNDRDDITFAPMCGRSSLHDAPVNVLERFGLPPVVPGFKPRYNIAPSQDQLSIFCDEEGLAQVRYFRWGLVPAWANERSIGSRMINARADTLATKPSWDFLLRKRRCLVLADGYYEWTSNDRRPMFFYLTGHRAFAMAGIWDRWTKNGETLETCAIITTEASPRARAVHHRMPLLLTPDSAEEWIDDSTRSRRAVELMTPYEAADLECYEVSRYVNSPANDSLDCIAPVS